MYCGNWQKGQGIDKLDVFSADKIRPGQAGIIRGVYKPQGEVQVTKHPRGAVPCSCPAHSLPRLRSCSRDQIRVGANMGQNGYPLPALILFQAVALYHGLIQKIGDDGRDPSRSNRSDGSAGRHWIRVLPPRLEYAQIQALVGAAPLPGRPPFELRVEEHPGMEDPGKLWAGQLDLQRGGCGKWKNRHIFQYVLVPLCQVCLGAERVGIRFALLLV